MKKLLLFLLLVTAGYSPAQSIKDFEGNWAGDLYSFSGTSSRKIAAMRLNITPTDSIGVWNYQMIYNEKDVRSYKLRTINKEMNLFAIDEGNSIILSECLTGNKLISGFEVNGSLLVVILEKKESGLLFETYSFSINNKKKSGMGNKEVPFVYDYPLNAFQRAALKIN